MAHSLADSLHYSPGVWDEALKKYQNFMLSGTHKGTKLAPVLSNRDQIFCQNVSDEFQWKVVMYYGHGANTKNWKIGANTKLNSGTQSI